MVTENLNKERFDSLIIQAIYSFGGYWQGACLTV